MLCALERFHGDHTHTFLLGVAKDGSEVRPVLEIVRDHDDIEPTRVHRMAHDRFEMRSMRGDAKEAQFSLFFEPIEGFVNVGVHEPVERVARMNMSKIEVVYPETFEAALNGSNDIFNRSVIAQMIVQRTKLRDNEELITRKAF